MTSLTEVVPTVTVMPTLTPLPSATPSFTDDAPDYSGYVSELSPLNTSLAYLINFKGDVDWFAFHNETNRTLEISLLNLPANYDVYVYYADTAGLSGASTNVGLSEDKIILENALPGDYFVNIVGVDGAWDASEPYQLIVMAR